MFVREYEWYIRHLAEHVDVNPADLLIVDNVASWCREHGVPEPDENKPVKLVSMNGSGRQIVVAEMIPDEVIEERINAASIRSQIRSVAHDWTDYLNSPMKKIAYLFLREYASGIPQLAYDDLAAEEWVFEQMDRIGAIRL